MHNKCMGLYGNLSGLSTHRRLSSCAAVLGPRYKRPERQGSPGKVLPEKLLGGVRHTSQNHQRGGGGGVLPEKLAGGVRSTSQNPYPIYDQNLQYCLPYL